MERWKEEEPRSGQAVIGLSDSGRTTYNTVPEYSIISRIKQRGRVSGVSAKDIAGFRRHNLRT